MAPLPKTLPLNIIDRQFLVPETDDFTNGSYLPMTTSVVVCPKVMPTVEALQEALIVLDEKSPEYRLGYTLDLAKTQWVRIADEERSAYLKGCVQVSEFDDLDDHLSAGVERNFSPLEHPFKVFIVKNAICIHLYHPMGDAIYLLQLAASLMTALYRPSLLDTVENRTVIPLGEVVMSNFSQTLKVLGHTVTRMREKVRNYLSGYSAQASANGSEHKTIFQPTITGTEMRVAHLKISPEKMMEIRSVVKKLPANQKITLNTFLQVFFAFRMNELGLVDWPIELATLISLRRYMKDPQGFYPGNCISNIRMPLHKSSFVEACINYQDLLKKLINNAYPLSDVVGNWFLSIAGEKAVKRAVRHWYLNSSPLEGRFYTFSNAGPLDDYFAPVRDDILPDVYGFTPIMGAAPLVIVFTSMDNYGHFTATYKPEFLSLEDIHAIINFDNIAATIGRFGTDD